METSDKKKKIFREKSLEKLSSPEQIDTLLVIVNPRLWHTLYTIIGVILIVLLWAIFGSIPIKVEGHGIVISEEGLFSVQSQIEGTVTKITVKPGQEVSKGDLIAEIYDPEKEIRLRTTENKVKNLSENLAELEKQILKETRSQDEAIKRDLAAKHYNVQQIEIEVEIFTDDYNKKKELSDQGLISKNTLYASEEKLIQKRIQLESTKASIAKLKADLAKDHRTEEYKQREIDLYKAKEELEQLQTKIQLADIYSPDDGRTLEVLTNVGDFIQPGEPLVWFEHTEEGEGKSLFYGYFPIEKGKLITPGDRVEISPTTVNAQEYGSIIGHVEEVSQYSVSTSSLQKLIQNEGLVTYLTQDKRAVIQVIVLGDEDPDSPNGFRWTSGEGPNIQITTGTVCIMKTIVDRVRPISYVLPVWKFRQTIEKLKYDEDPEE